MGYFWAKFMFENFEPVFLKISFLAEFHFQTAIKSVDRELLYDSFYSSVSTSLLDGF